MLDQLCLINMNARLYDPGLGIFLQADTVVPNPYSYSGYMRYSYVGNNPLAFVDPSGHVYGEPEQGPTIYGHRLGDWEWDQGEWGVFLFEGGYDGGSYIGAIATARPEREPPETVTVTAPRYIPPNYKTLLPPLPLPWNLPVPNFQLDQEGADSDPEATCHAGRVFQKTGTGGQYASDAAILLGILGVAFAPESAGFSLLIDIGDVGAIVSTGTRETGALMAGDRRDAAAGAVGFIGGGAARALGAPRGIAGPLGSAVEQAANGSGSTTQTCP